MPHPENPRAKTRPNRHRTDRGLTTLEWLLIVAAVAGLAALAVVLVQNVVDDTAEQISGSSARLTAARVAATEINEDHDTSDPTEEAEAKAKCLRLAITYGDALTDAAFPQFSLVAGTDDTPSSGDTYLWENSNKECQIPDSPSS